jgi:hypothetical protein
MNLGELKKSLAKLPPDMNDMEAVLVVARNGKRQMEPLTFVGYIPVQGAECVALGGLTAIQQMVEAGEIAKPPGYISPEISDPKLFGDDDAEGKDSYGG